MPISPQPKPVRAPKKPRKSAKTSARGNKREPRPPGPNGASAPLPAPPAGRNSVGAAETSSGDLEGCAFPKPVRQLKPRKPIKRKARLESKRRRRPRAVQAEAMFPKPVRPEGTKHRRRPREFGRMLFYKRLWCMLRDIARGGRVPPGIVDAATDCDGEIQVAHLGDRGASGTGGWRRAPDAKTAPLCKRHHQAIDGSVGGKAPWYVALGREGQRELRVDLVLFADFYWRGLTDEQRADWDARAAAQMKARRV